MNSTIRRYFDAMEDLRVVHRGMVKQADAFRTIHLKGVADDLDALADKLVIAHDRLMENCEADNPQLWAEEERRLDNILSPMLEKSIEDDERAKQ